MVFSKGIYQVDVINVHNETGATLPVCFTGRTLNDPIQQKS